MTTIAYDGKIVAIDSLMIGGDIAHCRSFQKMTQLDDETIIATTGNAYLHQAFVDAYNFTPFQCNMEDDNFEALVIKPDGSFRLYDEKGRSIEQSLPVALGSGAAVAYGAMDAGATAAEAVAIAIRRDIKSGGQVMSYTITEDDNAST